MAFTLGFHIILVPFGVALTFITMVANYSGIRHGDDIALRLAQRWSKVAAVLFAVGAVSGTVLSFELGLLWPGLMSRFGPAYGIPFAVEGVFFFLEAIFIAIYIYGWNRLLPWPHFWIGVPVVLSGLGGTASVVAANAWMNLPSGFTIRGDRVVDVHPVGVFFNDAFGYENRPHVPGCVHGRRIRRGERLRRRHAARAHGPVSPTGLRHPVRRRGVGDARPDRRRGHRGARGA
jgi:cytochrome d ubiquinol oxidase subunit I